MLHTKAVFAGTVMTPAVKRPSALTSSVTNYTALNARRKQKLQAHLPF